MRRVFFAFLVFTALHSRAQKELWGYQVVDNFVSPCQPGIFDGKIIKVPLSGSNQLPEVVHTFDVSGMQGKLPQGKLFQASNGKLYGVTGIINPELGCSIPLGTLFEYDLIFDRYRVITTNISQPSYIGSLIEASPGIIYGTTNLGQSIFKYVVATDTYSVVATLPTYLYNGNVERPKFVGDLTKASDGFIYGVTDIAPSSQNVTFYTGGIYRFNPATNQITKRYVFGLTEENDVVFPSRWTKLVEAQAGKLYGTSRGGSHYGPQGVAPLGSGTLFEYTIATNSIVKKFDFDYSVNGASPEPVIAQNNKIYGATLGIISEQFASSFLYPGGILYEYDLASNQFTIVHSFPYNPQNTSEMKHPVLKMTYASDGNFYGMCQQGIYRFNPTNSTVDRKIGPVYNGDNNEVKELIEICRKPSYQFIEVTNFDTCIGSNFSYDLHNSNAQTYQWYQNGTVLENQTTGILNLTNVTTSNAGTYTCVMTNECGVTTTMPFQLTVTCLGLTTVANLTDFIKLYPNPTHHTINLQLPQNIDLEIREISIINLVGLTIFHTKEKAQSIDVSHFEDGIYIITLSTNYGDWNGKFVKK